MKKLAMVFWTLGCAGAPASRSGATVPAPHEERASRVALSDDEIHDGWARIQQGMWSCAEHGKLLPMKVAVTIGADGHVAGFVADPPASGETAACLERGTRGARWRETEQAVTVPFDLGVEREDARCDEVACTVTPSLACCQPKQLTSGELRDGLEETYQGIIRCAQDAGLLPMTLDLAIGDDGLVEKVVTDPPAPDPARACMLGVTGAVRLRPTERGTQVRVQLLRPTEGCDRLACRTSPPLACCPIRPLPAPH